MTVSTLEISASNKFIIFRVGEYCLIFTEFLFELRLSIKFVFHEKYKSGKFLLFAEKLEFSKIIKFWEPSPMSNSQVSETLEAHRELYRDLTGLSAPRNLRTPLLKKLINWHCRCLENAVPHREAFFYRAQAIQEIKLPNQRQYLASGDIIIREHNGKNHIVRRKPDGKFIYSKRTYSSLTAIAKVITGVHQSGPRFFGLSKGGETKRP